MHAPYPLIEMPPGDFSDTFDFQAIHMAAAHNMFIQGVNAMVAHAPHIKPEKVKSFTFFCLSVLDLIHHHHKLEETFYFAALEEGLGEGALSGSQEEHSHFVPQIEKTEAWLKTVYDGREQYDSQALLEHINSFADAMVEHLNHEPLVLDRHKLRENFAEKQLQDIDREFMKHALDGINFYTTLPIVIVCGNPATPWFPPLPLPLKWATRWWFSRRHQDAWEFGPLDLAGKPKQLPIIATSTAT